MQPIHKWISLRVISQFKRIWLRFGAAGIKIKVMGITVGQIILLYLGGLIYQRMVLKDALISKGLSVEMVQSIITENPLSQFLFFFFMLALAILSGLVLSNALTRPVQRLVEATRAAGEGDLSQHVDAWFQDEIGDLTQSFNDMSIALTKAMAEAETKNQSLLQQNRELALINLVSLAIVSSTDLQEILRMALGEVLSAVNARAGWICLSRGHCWQPFTVHQGIISGSDSPFEPGCAGSCPFDVQDFEELEESKILWFQTGVHCDGIPDEWLTLHHGGFFSIPLRSKSQILGRLNAIRDDWREFTPAEQHLIRSAVLSLGVAIENLRLWDDIRQTENHRTLLLKKLVTVQEDERRWIARELHDEMGQELTSLIIGLKVLEKRSSTQEMTELISRMKVTIQDILTQIHNLAVELRPSVLDDLGLISALEHLARDFQSQMNITVEMDFIGMDFIRLPNEVETALYRIIQESLTNVARHAHTDHANVLVEFRGLTVISVIEDNGCGFDPDLMMRTDDQRKWVGLFGIEERAEMLGGKTTIESQPGCGTTVVVTIPVSEICPHEESR